MKMGRKKPADKKINTYAPLLAALARHTAGKRGAFHMPGHHQGRGQWPPFSRLLAEQGQALDLTELPGLDNLGAAAGCIEASQKAMARLSGSQEVFYLVNGSTAGLEAAILAMSSPEVPTVMSAHCHMAIHQGLILSGSRPVILPCLIDGEWGLPLGVDQGAAGAYFNEGAVQNAAQKVGQDKGLWISLNPSYNGVIADLAWEKEMLSRRPGWGWLADEAHGAHLPFAGQAPGPSPFSALYWGADVVVQSAHKMGCGFTQTALLHCNCRELAGKLRQGINIMQSSSPSYLLMASLDAWQAYLQEGGRQSLREAAELARELACRIRALGGYRLWQDELPASYTADPRKITVSAAELGLDGFALAAILRQKYGIDTELAAADYVLFIVNLGLDPEQGDYLVKALEEIQEHHGCKGRKSEGAKGGEAGDGAEQKKQKAAKAESKKLLADMYRSGQKPWQPVLSPREVFFSPRQQVKLEEAKDRLAAVPLVPYPPGIPLVFPGMAISGEAIAGLKDWLQAGQTCNGLARAGDQIFVEVLAE